LAPTRPRVARTPCAAAGAASTSVPRATQRATETLPARAERARGACAPLRALERLRPALVLGESWWRSGVRVGMCVLLVTSDRRGSSKGLTEETPRT
jgi:hypothetical protein